MGGLVNNIIAIVILIIVTAVSSTFFYKKGQEEGWDLARQLVPLKKGEIYLCVEKTGARGVSYLTVQEISKSIKARELLPKDLDFRFKLALNGMSLEEYNEKYRGGRKGD